MLNIQNLSLKRIEQAFYSAMRAGYGSNKSKIEPVSGYPASKSTRLETNGLLVVDTWFSNPGCDGSHGFTNIYCEDVLVWYMIYHGSYEPSAVKALKVFLQRSYLESRWVRGVHEEQIDMNGTKFEYGSHAPRENQLTFAEFRARETIHFWDADDMDWRECGHHFYVGGITDYAKNFQRTHRV